MPEMVLAFPDPAKTPREPISGSQTRTFYLAIIKNPAQPKLLELSPWFLLGLPQGLKQPVSAQPGGRSAPPASGPFPPRANGKLFRVQREPTTGSPETSDVFREAPYLIFFIVVFSFPESSRAGPLPNALPGSVG